MKTTTFYCELLTAEQVEEFETLMTDKGYEELERPAKWAERVPYWIRENKPRGENDDPLAAIILTLDHNNFKYSLYAAYRCTEGEMVGTKEMKHLISCLGYFRR